MSNDVISVLEVSPTVDGYNLQRSGKKRNIGKSKRTTFQPNNIVFVFVSLVTEKKQKSSTKPSP